MTQTHLCRIIPSVCHCEDGPEIQIIRREHVNNFVDWQDKNIPHSALEFSKLLNDESLERYGSPFDRLPESHQLRVRSEVARKESIREYEAEQGITAENDAIGSLQSNDPQLPVPMTPREKEVLQSFCILSNVVMKNVFKYQEAADCICADRAKHPLANFEFSDRVFDYIRRATYSQMSTDGIKLR